MMAQAGATLITLGMNPEEEVTTHEPQNTDSPAEAEGLPYLQTGLCSLAPPRFPS